ncbi:IS21-like element helper ATPase IstB [Variovorax sp. GT1P44]|uniref:IS21-like element helper ATPase IstB n=1 Tax=Variovorax sp. GT1P44 TaxID=3443742 RepID=UPI003F464333
MIKDILRLKYQGNLSHERIAQSLSISKGAVAKYLSLAGGAGLDWASTAELDEASLERRLLGGGAALTIAEIRNEREVRRIERHRNESGLTPDKQLSNFDFAAVPSVSKAQVMALAAGTEWLDRGASVLLFGPPGVGKSHLISGLGHALIDAGRRVLFVRCSELVQRLQTARRDLRLAQELAKLDRFDLLVLDDISYVRRDQAETSVLFELIAERYERKSIAITANTPFSQWGEVFVDAAMTVAAVDRLVHHSTILEMNVESYRRRAAQAAQAPAKRALAATTIESV